MPSRLTPSGCCAREPCSPCTGSIVGNATVATGLWCAFRRWKAQPALVRPSAYSPPCPFVLSAVHGQPRCGFAVTTPNFSDRIDQSDNDLVYSVGVGFTFVHRFNLQLEYEILDSSEFDHSDAYWLNASWRF